MADETEQMSAEEAAMKEEWDGMVDDNDKANSADGQSADADDDDDFDEADADARILMRMKLIPCLVLTTVTKAANHQA